MAHVYTLTTIPKPVLTLTLVAGGSLPENTTLYYRGCTSPYVLCKAGEYVSPVSDVKSITTTPTHRSEQIDFVHHSGAAEYSYLWCCPDTDPGVGGWNDKVTNPESRAMGEGSLYFYKMRWYNRYGELPEQPPGADGYIDLRYSVDVQVVDPDGTAIAGATVTLTNGAGDESFSVLTAADGSIEQQIITAKRNVPEADNAANSYVGGDVTEYGPFVLIIEATGKTAYRSEFEITEAVNDTIGLKTLGTAVVGNIDVEIEPGLTVEIETNTITVEIEE
ncbi:MAG: hypothetical protein DRJ50_00775 [Actinobacteria bacterium]|nr:MAG: hypothetical protein DRJ50_00775 [Actinomycetota bacterium]